jgi:hypothetical protein
MDAVVRQLLHINMPYHKAPGTGNQKKDWGQKPRS